MSIQAVLEHRWLQSVTSDKIKEIRGSKDFNKNFLYLSTYFNK